MENKSAAPTASRENTKPRDAGFYKRRRGVYEHIEDGTIDLLENGIHDYLCLKANLVIGRDSSKPAGVCFTSAPDLRAHCKRWVHSDRTMQRVLDHMEQIGWIRTWPRHHGNYPVLICRATVHDLSGNEYRVNAEATKDWQHPVYEPVGQLSANASKVGDYKRSESREVRVSHDRPDRPSHGKTKNLSLKGKAWEELEVTSLPTMFEPFVGLVEKNQRGEGEHFVDWAKRIMDLCAEEGIEYPRVFYKRLKRAERELANQDDPYGEIARVATSQDRQAEAERMSAELESRREAEAARFNALSQAEKLTELRKKLADTEEMIAGLAKGRASSGAFTLELKNQKAELERQIVELQKEEVETCA